MKINKVEKGTVLRQDERRLHSLVLIGERSSLEVKIQHSPLQYRVSTHSGSQEILTGRRGSVKW